MQKSLGILILSAAATGCNGRVDDVSLEQKALNIFRDTILYQQFDGNKLYVADSTQGLSQPPWDTPGVGKPIVNGKYNDSIAVENEGYQSDVSERVFTKQRLALKIPARTIRMSTVAFGKNPPKKSVGINVLNQAHSIQTDLVEIIVAWKPGAGVPLKTNDWGLVGICYYFYFDKSGRLIRWWMDGSAVVSKD